MMSREDFHRQMVELSLRHIKILLLIMDYKMGLLETKVDAIIIALHRIESKFAKESTKEVANEPAKESVAYKRLPTCPKNKVEDEEVRCLAPPTNSSR